MHSEIPGKRVSLFTSQGNMIPTTASCNTAPGRLGARHGVGWRVLSLSLYGVAEAYRTCLQCRNFPTSSPQKNSWMATPCPWRGLGDTCAPATLRRREPRGHGVPDVLWTGSVSVSVFVSMCVYMCALSVFMCSVRGETVQLPKPNHIGKG